MRTEVISKGGVSVRAISGTRSVLFAFDVEKKLRDKLLGFAVQRRSAAAGAKPPFWFKASKVFKEVVPEPGQDARFSTLFHPIQSLVWGDYTTEPGTRYHYVVRPVLGIPSKLEYGADVEFTVETEPEETEEDGVWFNRGAIASQVFAREFKNRAPRDVDDETDETTVWLSRGLLEACLRFINDTKEGEQLLVAAYEFTYAPVLRTLKAALDRGVDLRIVYDASVEQDKNTGEMVLTDSGAANQQAIEDYAFPEGRLYPRQHSGDIPHNKFFVRIDADDAPVAVWTGSTNFTASGFLGQSNVGHVVKERDTAGVYRDYWLLLQKDLPRDEMRPEVEKLSFFENQVGQVEGETPIPVGISAVFSPRKASKMLKWYADRIEAASNGVMWTGAFSVAQALAEAFEGKHPHPRFLLLEKPPSATTVNALKGSKNLQIAYGNVLGQRYVPNAKGELTMRREIPEFELEKWFLEEEHYRRTGHVYFIHTKFLLVDPLGEDPLVFSGSANFSANSLLSNDENMLLIRGNKRLADIYMTEFDRLLRHFYFRDVAAELHGTGNAERGKFLYDKPSDWLEPNYRGFKNARREMFFPE